MKKFVTILIGSYLGSFLATNLIYSTESPEFWSYGATLIALLFVSIVFSLISLYSLHIFSVKSSNYLLLGTVFFFTQILAYVSTELLPDFGILTIGGALIVFSLIAAFFLGLIEKGRGNKQVP